MNLLPPILALDGPHSDDFYLSVPHRKGRARSALPYVRTAPVWIKQSADDLVKTICEYSRKGMTASQIGVRLRDQHGIPQVRQVTGKLILKVLKANNLAPEIPEDLYFLIKTAVSIRKHLRGNRKDKNAKYRLILCESRIHRISRYYKRSKVLPPSWKYNWRTAPTLVSG